MSLRTSLSTLSIGLLSVALTACGGGDVTLGGTLTGLPSGTTVTLQNNSADDLTLSANGSFSFSEAVSEGDTYAVTVLTNPVGAYCYVTSGTGTISSTTTEVTSVLVTCVSSASVTGTVSGLASGAAVTLTNGTTTLPIAANGAFAFPGVLAAGTAYSVTVATQPVGQTCTVINGAGAVVSGVSTAIVVGCS